MQKFVMERHRLLVPDYTCTKALKLLRSWKSRRRICAVHFYRNFSIDYPGAKPNTLFWTACNAYTEHVHKQAMEAIKESVAENEWLLREPRIGLGIHFLLLKFPDNTTNFVESFNWKIEKLRSKPIFTLLEEIRRKFMKTIAHRFKVPKSWPGVVVPNRECLVTPARRGIFEVLNGVTSFTVDLNVHHCDCMDPVFWKVKECPSALGEIPSGAANATNMVIIQGVTKSEAHVATSSTQLSSQKRQTRSSSRQSSSTQPSSTQPSSTQPPSRKKQTRKQSSQPQSASNKQKSIQGLSS
ncbi:LOW QUALITY PROTEIN: hypothetical protein Cgig2_019781 [Carnegiea gigantea]|uniref:Uncharacterized protein n=1 Tax=Carnegiea gigantea TaxID=171969 RepID=A0A9Q1KF46_9CARY|nr:LOW QUALITY PROTEIN: hypothetical protein Cgig2_019781 [Carnegiea gigantea]